MIACLFLPFSQGLKERFETYRRAYNQHDLKAVLSFLAPDYEFKVANSTYKVAKKCNGPVKLDTKLLFGELSVSQQCMRCLINEGSLFISLCNNES
jgi:hypothetical protein